MRLRGHCRAGISGHSCSWLITAPLLLQKKSKQLLPHGRPAMPFPPSPATHTPEGLVVPGGTARSWLSNHVWWWRASRAEKWSGLGAVWRQGSAIGWEGVEVKPGWLWWRWRCGALFLPLLSPDWPFSLSHAPPALQPPPPPIPPPFAPFCGLCTCSPWVWAIKLKDLSGGWRKSGGNH